MSSAERQVERAKVLLDVLVDNGNKFCAHQSDTPMETSVMRLTGRTYKDIASMLADALEVPIAISEVEPQSPATEGTR